MLINCSICLGDVSLFDRQVSVLNCGHFFHANCLNDWLNVELNCPECRAPATRGAFAANIYPKLNQETVSQIKSLEETKRQLLEIVEKKEKEILLLKLKILSVNQKFREQS